MKLLAFSDFHGLYGLTNHFRDVKKRISETLPDILVFCGDFRNLISIPLLESRMRRLKFPAIYYVWGNDDGVDPEFKLKVGTNLHLKLIQLDDKSAITGIGGDELDVQWNIDKLDALLSKKEVKKVILISHVPPFGCCDFAVEGKHVGSEPLRTLINKYQPSICIFGHIHEQSQKSAEFNNTLFWNVGPNGIVIDL
ncbi:MAG: metallophosphoesterase family protein [Candidatus Helarchaeota archaeon]|nr:metallophosphoesterase family protein [Candidatus Helarchaeota archaeon]